MALNQIFESPVSTIRVQAGSGGVTAGKPVLSGNLVGIPMTAASSGEWYSLAIRGGFVYSAVIGNAVVVGSPLFYQPTTNVIVEKASATVGTDYFIGLSTAAYSAKTYTYVMGAVNGTTGSTDAGVGFMLTPCGYSQTSTYLSQII